MNDKPWHFKVGEMWSSEGKSFNEIAAIAGKPVAEAIAHTQKESHKKFVVTKVDLKERSITISEDDAT